MAKVLRYDDFLAFFDDLKRRFTEVSGLESITYADLVAKVNDGELVPGQQYRITDYVTTTAQANTQSAGHAFDIIVTADSTDTLNENARAVLHEGDTYFASQDLAAWKLKYSIYNDTNMYKWADSANGKGVIWYMEDAFGNQAPYDFKNIQFKRCKITATTTGATGLVGQYYAGYKPFSASLAIDTTKFTVDTSDSGWCYTFDYGGEDYSKNTSGKCCFNNVILKCYELSAMAKKFQFLPQNVFHNTNNTYCYGNIIGIGGYNNDFGGNCQLNEIGAGAYQNIMDTGCSNNNIGCGSYGNIFATGCETNKLGEYCHHNTFGSSCLDNILGRACEGNSFGMSCGANYGGNILGRKCARNTFADGCENNILADGCQDNTFGSNCGSNTLGQFNIGNIMGNDTFYTSMDTSYMTVPIVFTFDGAIESDSDNMELSYFVAYQNNSNKKITLKLWYRFILQSGEWKSGNYEQTLTANSNGSYNCIAKVQDEADLENAKINIMCQYQLGDAVITLKHYCDEMSA